jgi:hypothetical protein
MRLSIAPFVLLVLACTKPSVQTVSSSAPQAVPSLQVSPSAVPSAQQEAACGTLPCVLFDTPEAAFQRVLDAKPAVLALGETHPLADAPPVPGAAVRMTKLFMPMLRDRASDFVLELWVGNGRCSTRQKKEIAAVQTAQREVTQNQAKTNQGDFIALYSGARAAGLHAHLLVPNCDEYGKIIASGGGDIDMMLSLIARLSGDKIETLLAGSNADAGTAASASTPNDAGDALRMIVAYGGAMHNDSAPRPGREAWSYGPRIAGKHTGYVELDLVIPEFVKDTDAWKAQPWYPSFTRGAQGSKTLLYTVRPGSYVLVFPETTVPLNKPAEK